MELRINHIRKRNPVKWMEIIINLNQLKLLKNNNKITKKLNNPTANLRTVKIQVVPHLKQIKKRKKIKAEKEVNQEVGIRKRIKKLKKKIAKTKIENKKNVVSKNQRRKVNQEIKIDLEIVIEIVIEEKKNLKNVEIDTLDYLIMIV
jgi:hypothetical protein